MSLIDGYEVVVGLEVHVQLLTASKLFSPAPTSFGAEANSNVDIVDAGLPGTLPVLNARAVDSCGSQALDNSVVNAVYKASPLPLPSEPTAFDPDLNFIFEPPRF